MGIILLRGEIIMKKYIKEFPVIINADIVEYPPSFYFEYEDNISASYDLSKFNIPDGEVISKYANQITDEMVSDFEDFMEAVELFCEENCELFGTYKNVSDDHSHYYNYLVTDGNNNIIIDFKLKLRITNHTAKRNKKQKYNKKSENDSKVLNNNLSLDEISRLKPIPKTFIVNNEKFNSYVEAADYVFRIIEETVEKMKKNEKYRDKKPILKSDEK